MENQNFVIAIDGYSSCGKSTLAKQLASHFNFAYIDSGAMYRAVTLHFIRKNINLENHLEIEKELNSTQISFTQVDNSGRIYLNGEDVSEEIRQMHVAERVSKVSPIPAVRIALVAQQQNMGVSQNIIMDGRDIGTHVFPYASVKLFMTASPQKRAERRYQELSGKNPSITLEEIYTNLAQRDYDDTTRVESPLRCATDAITIDNSELTMAEQLELAIEIINSQINIYPKKLKAHK